MRSHRNPRFDDLTRHTGGQPTVAWWREAAISGIGFALAIGGLGLLWLLARPLTLVMVAVVIAHALAPVVARLERWLPRTLAVVLVYLVLVAVLATVGWLVLPPLVSEAQTLLVNAPVLLARVREWLDGIDPDSAARVVNAAQSVARRFSDVVLSLPLLVFSSTIEFVLVIFMSAYWLISMPAMSRFTLSLFPEERRQRTSSVLNSMGDTVGGYLRGTVINGLIIGVLTYVGLRLIGVDYPVVLAVLAAFGEFLPVVGPILAAIPSVLIAVAHSPEQALVVLIFYVVLQQVEANLLLPLVMRHQADVPPLLSLVAILGGSALGGLLGALIAIPLLGALRVLVVRVVAPAEREWTGVADAPTEVGAVPDEDG